VKNDRSRCAPPGGVHQAAFFAFVAILCYHNRSCYLADTSWQEQHHLLVEDRLRSSRPWSTHWLRCNPQVRSPDQHEVHGILSDCSGWRMLRVKLIHLLLLNMVCCSAAGRYQIYSAGKIIGAFLRIADDKTRADGQKALDEMRAADYVSSTSDLLVAYTRIPPAVSEIAYTR